MINFIGLNIRYLCVKNKLSQKEFGDLFDQKTSTISTYTGGRSNPNIETIQKICKHFDITIDDFINMNLEERGYIKKAVKAGMVAEPAAPYGDVSKIIAAQEKTIATLEKHITVLEKQVGYLEGTVEKLEHKAS